MGLVVKDDGWRISDELWQEMERFLPPRKKHPLGCHRSRVADRNAMNAILFVLRTGCQWGALDATGICKHSSAHRRFQEWTAAGVFEQFWIYGLLCHERLRGIQWDWLAMDGALTKAPWVGKKTGPNPTDRAKRGTKRSVLTDGAGVPLAVTVAGANRNDFKLARETLERLEVERPKPTRTQPQNLCLDKGYDYTEIPALAQEFSFTLHVPKRGQTDRPLKRRVKAKARRWVVERTHSWVNRFRGLLTRWNKKAQNYLAMLHLALGLITWRETGLMG